jgi:potassium channel subfamily K member 18
VTTARRQTVQVAWNATFRVNKLDRKEWERTVYAQTRLFQRKCMWAIRRGYDGKEVGHAAQWTFTGAFLYSLTVRKRNVTKFIKNFSNIQVITTIGYGNTAAKTYFGKALTILFAIIGIPLMLLFLTNIGDVMAKIFRLFFFLIKNKSMNSLASLQLPLRTLNPAQVQSDPLAQEKESSQNSASQLPGGKVDSGKSAL